MTIFGEDLGLMGVNLLRLGLAALIALPLAVDRERAERTLGLRTFPLIAMASCGFFLVADEVVGDNADALSRVFEGTITGVGFLGGGAIVKHGVNVYGTATATSMWATAGVGIAVAYGRLEIAIALSAATFVSLRFLRPLKGLTAQGQPASERDGAGRDL